MINNFGIGFRGSAAELLEHKFCKKYATVDMVYLKKWIRTVR